METATEAVVASTHSVLCRPERSAEEKAEIKARRMQGHENAKRLLAMAEIKAIEGDAEVADALVKIAQAWDSISY